MVFFILTALTAIIIMPFMGVMMSNLFLFSMIGYASWTWSMVFFILIALVFTAIIIMAFMGEENLANYIKVGSSKKKILLPNIKQYIPETIDWRVMHPTPVPTQEAGDCMQ